MTNALLLAMFIVLTSISMNLHQIRNLLRQQIMVSTKANLRAIMTDAMHRDGRANFMFTSDLLRTEGDLITYKGAKMRCLNCNAILFEIPDGTMLKVDLMDKISSETKDHRCPTT